MSDKSLWNLEAHGFLQPRAAEHPGWLLEVPVFETASGRQVDNDGNPSLMLLPEDGKHLSILRVP